MSKNGQEKRSWIVSYQVRGIPLGNHVLGTTKTKNKA